MIVFGLPSTLAVPVLVVLGVMLVLNGIGLFD